MDYMHRHHFLIATHYSSSRLCLYAMCRTCSYVQSLNIVLGMSLELHLSCLCGQVSSEADHATLLITLDSKSDTDLQLASKFLTSHLPQGCTLLGEETDVRVLLSPRM